jgi:hypothetical protein
VTVVTPFLYFGANMGFTFLDDYLRLLPEWGVRVLPQSVCQEIRDGQMLVANGATGKIEELACDFAVAGIPPAPDDELAQTCKRHAETLLVGDVNAPRSALEAIRQGDRAARML